MKELLDKLKELLSESVSEVVDSLNSGAKEDDIKQVEQVIGYQLPDDVKELYKIHNGQTGNSGLFCGLPFISLDEALQDWKTWNDVAQQGNSSLDSNIISVPSNHIKEVFCNKYYFPISKDYGGNNIVIDMDPDLEGITGQVINAGRDEEMRFVISTDIASFIKFIISQFENKNIRIERENQSANWYLKTPSNSHFFDTLKELDLPFGIELETKEQNNLTFDVWVESLESTWKEYITEELGQTSWQELKKIKSLSLLRHRFSEIKPLTEFTGLRELILTGNPFADLSPLKSLENLQKLYLAKTSINSIDTILELPNLTQLSLFKTEINSLDGISKLNKLKSLSIESTFIQDIKEIGKLKRLIELDLSKNQFVSFDPLRNLKALKELNLSNTNFNDLSIIGELTNLESLIIYDTEVMDFRAIVLLEKLNHITCSFEDFLKIKEVIKHEVRFGIAGEMTEEQKEYWRNYSWHEKGYNKSYDSMAEDAQSEKKEGKSNFWNKLKKKWF